jgi:hypothetical protein
MKAKFLLPVVPMVLGICFTVLPQDNLRKAEPAMVAFWTRFQSAVSRVDKAGVAAMSGFPLEMPYGTKRIKTKQQFLKDYSRIFDVETKKCFAEAKPQPDEGKRKRFWIGCGEAMMYWFEQRNGVYKFVAVDNVNE